MAPCRGRKGQKGFGKARLCHSSQRHRLHKGKQSKKSPVAPPVPPQSNADTIQLLTGGESNPNIQRNLNATFDNIASSAAPAARPQLARASKTRCGSGVQYNVEPHDEPVQ